MAEHGKLTADIHAFDYPASAKNTVNMARDVTAADFAIAAPKGANEVTARVIGVIENQAPTRALEKRLKVSSGLVDAEMLSGVCQIAMVERHKATGGITNAFVSGSATTSLARSPRPSRTTATT